MINYIESAPSNQSACIRCRKSIKAGEKRGVEATTSFGHPSQRFYCKECTIKEIKLLIDHLTKLEI